MSVPPDLTARTNPCISYS